MDPNSSAIRFAIIRFRDNDDPGRLRVLLRQHGYEEPTWLLSNGQRTSTPPIPDVPSDDCDVQIVETTGPTQPGTSRTPYLTLPTILMDGHRWLTSQQRATSAVLPLVTVRPEMPARSTSSRLSVIVTPQVSPCEMGGPSSSKQLPATDSQCPASDEPGPSGVVSGAVKTWVSPAPLRPRGKRPNPNEDPNVYYTCTICKNKILGTRVSNLQNHVRRHSTVKQFKCVYCDYAHNEIAKVRLHMTNNHKDSESAPVNNLTIDMQAIWRSLFRECFPTRAQRRRGARAADPSKPGPSGLKPSTQQDGPVQEGRYEQDSEPGPSGSQSDPTCSQSALSRESPESICSSSSTMEASWKSYSNLHLFRVRRRRLFNNQTEIQQQIRNYPMIRHRMKEDSLYRDHKNTHGSNRKLCDGGDVPMVMNGNQKLLSNKRKQYARFIWAILTYSVIKKRKLSSCIDYWKDQRASAIRQWMNDIEI